MIGPVLRRDRSPGARGFLAGLVGPLLAACLVTLVALVVFGDSTMTEIVLLFGINAIMTVGFQVFVGNTGLVSFGHVAFMAIGAYAAGILSIPSSDKELFYREMPDFLVRMEVGAVPSLLIAGTAAALVALVAGAALMRMSGAAASIATLGLLIITVNVLSQASTITNGPRALFGIPDRTTFWLTFACLGASVLASAAFKWSPWGLRARASRDDVIAADTVGVPPLRARLPAFVLSAFITGVGGGLYAQLLTAFTPSSFSVMLVVVIVTMAILGGIQSITGAVAGATLVTVINELLRRVEAGVTVFGTEIRGAAGMSAAILGILLILMLRWRPEGLFAAAELQLERRDDPESTGPPQSIDGATRETPVATQ